ncbi:MAG: hypothetical protein M9894_33095 [Planctomycetes bacterium]|nr:hypothetical protein [Planctomycetota bacterium]
MDQILRTLGRAASATGDREAVLRHAVARVRAGALVALTRVDARKQDAEARAKERWPRLYVGSEPEGGDLTPRARRAALREALVQLGWPGVKATWSLKAGCGCGCSPAYVLRGEGARGREDVWVDVYVDPREREVGLA